MIQRFVVEITDEDDDLIGFAVCIHDTVAQTWRLMPTVHGTRSGAWAVIERYP